MDFKKIINNAKDKAKEILEKDSTKKIIQEAKDASLNIKNKFDEAYDKADEKIKSMLDKKEESDSSIEDTDKAKTVKDKNEVETVKKKNEVKVVEDENEVEVVEDKNEVEIVEDKNEVEDKSESKNNVDDLSSLGLTAKIISTLNSKGINSVSDLKNITEDELSSYKGVGKATVEKLSKYTK